MNKDNYVENISKLKSERNKLTKVIHDLRKDYKTKNGMIKPYEFIRNPNLDSKISDIVKIVSAKYLLSEEDILGFHRVREKSEARGIVIYFARKEGITLKYIGDYFGGRDHSTILNSIKRINDLIDTDWKFRGKMESLKSQVERLVK